MDYVGINLISVTCAIYTKCAEGTQTGLVSSKLEYNPLFYYVPSHDLFSSLLVLWIRCCVPVVKTLATFIQCQTMGVTPVFELLIRLYCS